MFNEGVDIPAVDMVMFLRPTESPVVFLQQLGRGLRRSAGKEYLNVLDFIGNYEKAGRVRYFLTGKAYSSEHPYNPAERDDFSDDCLVDFDMRLIDIFKELDKKQMHIRDQIRQEYARIKEQIGKRPSRMDLFTYMDDDIYRMAIAHAKDNPFRDYLEFLREQNDLTEEEQTLCSGIGKEFIHLLETTSMSKVYKMPVHFLMQSGKGFFVQKEGYALALADVLKEAVQSSAFSDQMGDVIAYRTIDYYRRRYQDSK